MNLSMKMLLLGWKNSNKYNIFSKNERLLYNIFSKNERLLHLVLTKCIKSYSIDRGVKFREKQYTVKQKLLDF